MQKICKKSLLYKSKVEYADFCLNHVEGCSHGCRYPCYAMLMAKRFGKVTSYSEWIKPKLVSNAMQLLDREIPRYKDQIKCVHLCFTTDPFMYNNKDINDMTLKIIKKLNDNRIKCTALTKGVLPKELSSFNGSEVNNEYGITLISLNESYRKQYEPGSAPYEERIKSLNYLHNKGCKTWVSIEPYPTPNILSQNLMQLLNKVAFADKIIFGKLNYNALTSMFKAKKQFYNECADIVGKFCKMHGIDCHIKFGTQEESNFLTRKIFKRDLLNIEQPNCCVAAVPGLNTF